MAQHDTSWVSTEMTLAQPAPASQAGIVAWIRKNLFATPFDSVLIHSGCSGDRLDVAAYSELGAVQRPVDRCRPYRLPDGEPGRHSAGRVVRRLLGFRECEVRAVHVWPLPGGRALARHPDCDHLYRAAHAAADPARALQGAERRAVLRGFPVRGVLPAHRRFLRPALCRDRALGRPAGNAGAFLCRHRRVPAARHCPGTGAAFQDAGDKAAFGDLHRSRAWRAAGHRAFHGGLHAASVRPAGRHLRQIPAGPDRRGAVRLGLYGGSRARWIAGDSQGTVRRAPIRSASATGRRPA